MHLVINTRTLAARQSGVQRYTAEIVSRIGIPHDLLRPEKPTLGLKGHVWEQLMLPVLARGALLFSPANTGPLACRNQVVTIHDTATFDFPEAFSGPFGRWYRALTPRLARGCAKIITVSQFSKTQIVNHCKVSPDKVVVIPNGVTQFGESHGVAPTPADRFGLTRPFLLFVGSNEPRKNLRALISAFERKLWKDFDLVIAGGANPRVFSDANPSSHGQKWCRFVGYVTEAELESLYASAKAFVFPSAYEGFGLPPLEAMARGCPVITSNATSLPEVCGKDVSEGGQVFYFDPANTASMEESIDRMLNTSQADLARIKERARNHAKSFTWDACAKATEAVLAAQAALK